VEHADRTIVNLDSFRELERLGQATRRLGRPIRAGGVADIIGQQTQPDWPPTAPHRSPDVLHRKKRWGVRAPTAARPRQLTAARPASKRATGSRNGKQDT